MLRIFLFFLCLYIFYLLFFSKKDPKKAKKQKFRVYHGAPQTPEPKNLIVGEMKRCPACGTFNPKSHAVEFQGEYFCNEECREKRV